MKILNTLSIITILLLNGCGGGNTTNTKSNLLPTVDVKYTLNGTERPTCHNAGDKGELNPSPDDLIICTWLCGRYQGSNTVTVSLSFEKSTPTEAGIWELENESITEALESVCRDI